MTRLSGKAALVTGASRGIGQAIARRLAADGAFVIVHYGRTRQGGEDTVRMIEAAGGKAILLGADLDQPAERTRLVDRIGATLSTRGFDGLDILVNNAGIGGPGSSGEPESIRDVNEDLLDQLYSVNVKACFLLTQAILPHLRDGGRIINLSSTVSLAATPAAIAYAMTKAAVNSLTRSLAADLGARQITVNAVAPGATDTDFIRPLLADPDNHAAYSKAAKLGRIGQPDDIADVVAFLASADGRWITGQVIEASGGLLL